MAATTVMPPAPRAHAESGASKAGIRCEREKQYPIMYRGEKIYVHSLDIVVDDKLVLELKSVERLHPVHTAQTISCLRASKLPVALLINFNVEVLVQGIRRIVL